MDDSDVIYMDPPYQGVCGDRDSRYLAGIDHDEFAESLAALNRRNARYMVSYDGRLGERAYGRFLPAGLNLKRIELEVGRSSQATLLGRDEVTIESLYLSPALVKQLPPTRITLAGYHQSPQQLHLFAMRQVCRVDLIWQGDEVKSYDRLEADAREARQPVPAFVKRLIERALSQPR